MNKYTTRWRCIPSNIDTHYCSLAANIRTIVRVEIFISARRKVFLLCIPKLWTVDVAFAKHLICLCHIWCFLAFSIAETGFYRCLEKTNRQTDMAQSPWLVILRYSIVFMVIIFINYFFIDQYHSPNSDSYLVSEIY